MPSLLQTDVPLQKTSSITKALRSRDAPLLSLLPTARDLYSSTSTSVFFPRRNEWLLEWLVQRLKEDDGPAGRAARTSRDCWEFLLELLHTVDAGIFAATLKRHGIVPLVAKMIEEVRGAESPEDGVAGLLDGVAAVLARLRETAKQESSISASLKAAPEVCAGILGAFLAICRQLLERGLPVDHRWVDAVVNLWRGSIWGNANSRKISAVWSEKCLGAAAALLVMPNIMDSLETTLKNMVAEYVFGTEILFPVTAVQKQSSVKPSTKELLPLLAPLKLEDTAMLGTYLPLLFHVAIKSQERKRSKADLAVVEALFTALLSVVPGLDLEPEVPNASASGGDIIASLLQVLIETGTALSSATLSRIVTKFAHLVSKDAALVRWSLVQTVLEIDFDTFLHPSVTDLNAQLFSALARAKPSDQVSRVLGLVVDGFVKARDVPGFVERWKEQLNAGDEGDVWRSDALARAFAPIVEDSLTTPQVVKTVDNLRVQKQWIILDAILRGLRREETELRLLATGALAAVIDSARSDGNNWRAWRLLVRIGSISPQLLLPIVEDAVRVVKGGKKWKEAMFASEVLIRLSEDTDDEEALKGAQVVVDTAAESLSKSKAWDGKITIIDKKSFGIALAMAIVGGHLGILEKVEGSHRKKFVDSLLSAALAVEAPSGLADARQVCQALVTRAELYEYPAVKEALLSALILGLAPFYSVSGDMSSAIKNPPRFDPENKDSYEFIVSCIQQYPLEAMRRTSREKILDICLLLDVSGFSYVRPLMYKIWKVGNGASFMATDCRVIKRLFAVPGATNIFRRILNHIFLNRENEKNKAYLKELIEMNHKILKGSKKGEGLSAGDLEMAWVTITEFWKFKNDESIAGDLEKMRKKYLQLLMKSLDSEKQINAKALNYFRETWELERDDREDAKALAAKVVGKTAAAWSTGVVDADSAVESLGVVCAVAESVEDVMNVTAFAVVAAETLKGERQADILRHYQSTIERLDIPTHREVTRRVVDSWFSEDVGDNIWEPFMVLINNIKKPETPEELSASVDVFSAVHSRLLISLPSSRSSTSFLINTKCINTLLRSHSWTIIQHNLDTTISALTLAACPHGPSLTSSVDTDTLYISLTSVLSSILSLHRHRIRGRYHLIITLLQTLLTLLFTPKLSRRKTERALHPPWLLPPNNPHLTVTSARAFARVLQTFCDPPVSTVRTHNSELTESERSKERKMVGNVVGPVLECFVKRVLEERIDVAVRREVGLGVEKVLEVLGRDGVKKVTARMSAEARAVVRGLWAEFGKGRGERV
ncbi:Urb2/Npa2 family-domain-containing protein [Sphaerosporella brunnea]|uniref:Urb2/Npa2 family-domain-containing protein n=1 Tax=Sphaerosporella brunnea TaxID=1250544 RepID=A0A5J5EWX5_9PEZI|nr:Urb2/Npa2 family-domain-containing protein [Sphaerosporella brunnea]